MRTKSIKLFVYVNQMSGKTWVNLWSLIAVTRFALGKPIDSVFLGVLGFYAAHSLGSKIVGGKDGQSNS